MKTKKIGVGFASIPELEKKYVNEALDDSCLSPSMFVRKFEEAFAKNMESGME